MSPPEVAKVGDVLAGRYELLRQVGAGGSGVVFAARDRELQQDVALKIPRALDASARDRLREEVRTARAVAHANVCRVFDLTSWESSDGERVFLTMELLEGPSLTEALDEEGAFSASETLRLAADLASGIDAIHAAGLVHGDIKSSNVLLVGPPESRRAVIADFGLAHVRGSGGGGGTAAFVAPEQLTGAAEPASDVYSLGVLLHHAVTGELPFRDKTRVGQLLARTREPGQTTRPGRLGAVIDECLRADPKSRPTAAALVAQVEASSAAMPRGRSRLAAAALAAVATLLLIALLFRGFEDPEALRAHSTRPIVAVLGFQEPPESHEAAAWFGALLAQGLRESLARTASIRTLDHEETFLAVRPDAQSDATAVDRRLGAAAVLVGRFEPAGDAGTLRLEVELHSAQRPAASSNPTFVAQTAPDEWRSGLEVLSAKIIDAVAPPGAERERPRLATAERPSILPQSDEAARSYAEALDHLLAADTNAAIASLQRALDFEGDHAGLLKQLAKAHGHRGDDAKAAEVARRALTAAQGAERGELLEIEAQLSTFEHRWDRAVELYSALWEFYPDRNDYGIELARAQDRAAQLDEATATLERLRQRRISPVETVETDLVEALVSFHRGDATRAVERGEAAVREAEEQGIPRLQAQAHDLLAFYKRRTDSTAAERRDHIEKALALFRDLGERGGEASSLLRLAVSVRDEGDLLRAEPLFLEALELARLVGDLRIEARALSSLAQLVDQQGRLSEGLKLKQAVTENYRERDIRQGLAINTENIGITYFKLGQLGEALRHLHAAGELYQELGDELGVRWTPYYVGRVWMHMGDLDLAASSFATARRSAERDGDPGLHFHLDFEDALLAFERGEHAEAIERIRSNLAESRDSGQARWVADGSLLLARALLADGRTAAARAAALEAREYYVDQSVPARQIEADTVLLEIALEDSTGGDLEERRSALAGETRR
ncbi:MAG: protein kinase, partial [Acidobacteriota bacterium]